MPEQLDLFTRKLKRPKGGKLKARKTARKAPRKRKPTKKPKAKKNPGIASTAAFRLGFLAGIAERSHMGR